MMSQGGTGPRQKQSLVWRGLRIGLRLCACLPLAMALVVHGAQSIPTDPPIAFFTNVAGRLLRSGLNLDLNQIQVYPTNQYTPAVHRLLQVAANLYDSTTNRCFAAPCSAPYCPSVFRPLFRRTETGAGPVIFIAGYREVSDISMAIPATAPALVAPADGIDQAGMIPLVGTPPDPNDGIEPMVSGIPLVLGARKGFPNFNEFSVQTCVLVSRLLEFRRAVINGPVALTNQMYTLMLSNTFGVEAWNSYSNPYPRNLQLLGGVDITAIITNLDDAALGHTVLSNRLSRTFSTDIAANTWQGWPNLSQLPDSFLLPLGNTNNYVFTNASYQDPWLFLEPLTHIFSRTDSFYVPRWWLNLNIRVRFVLVDTDAQRIVDYVNLDGWEPTLDITAKLAEGAGCSGNATTLSNPASQWCTNRFGSSADPRAPTIGVLNQIAIGLGLSTPTLQGFALDPYAGPDIESDIDGFRYNLMSWGPMYAKDIGKIFYRSNVFYAPLDPSLPVYVHTSWQANDPLVHYLVEDLGATTFLPESNRVNFASQNPPLANLGFLNNRSEPWGGNPFISRSQAMMPPFGLAAKDPLIWRSDMWNFPTNQALEIGWVGQVHRGTPWQTIFLKSTNVLLQTGVPAQGLAIWQKWTGDDLVHPDWVRGDTMIADAALTTPTNDWQLISRLAPLFNKNDLSSLTSVNQSTGEAWSALLDGITAVTNPAPGEIDTVAISSNSPLAVLVGRSLEATRSAEPNGIFGGLGDILATPELSSASPWLTTSTDPVDDASWEILPSQILARLRPDSFGQATSPNATSPIELTFTGFDDYEYTVETSSNLVDWTSISSTYPTNGTFKFTFTPGGPLQNFFRCSAR